MEAHEHPDLLDDQIHTDEMLDIEPIAPDQSRPTCPKCRSTHIEHLSDHVFWTQYCGFCGLFS